MEEMGLYLWSMWPAILVLLGMGCPAMGHFRLEFSLHIRVDAWVPL